MSIFGKQEGQQSAPPPVPNAPPPPPTFASAQVSQAGAFQAQKTFGGFGSTLLTSGQGDTSTPLIGKKTLLGA